MSTEVECQWCGVVFERRSVKGPTPKYCSPAHRQEAYRARRSVGAGVEIAALLASSATDPRSSTGWEALRDVLAQQPTALTTSAVLSESTRRALAEATKFDVSSVMSESTRRALAEMTRFDVSSVFSDSARDAFARMVKIDAAAQMSIPARESLKPLAKFDVSSMVSESTRRALAEMTRFDVSSVFSDSARDALAQMARVDMSSMFSDSVRESLAKVDVSSMVSESTRRTMERIANAITDGLPDEDAERVADFVEQMWEADAQDRLDLEREGTPTSAATAEVAAVLLVLAFALLAESFRAQAVASAASRQLFAAAWTVWVIHWTLQQESPGTSVVVTTFDVLLVRLLARGWRRTSGDVGRDDEESA